MKKLKTTTTTMDRLARYAMHCATAAVLIPPALSYAQTPPSGTWPVRPIRYIVPFPPGGGTDVSARAVTAAMSAELGQQVIVENRAGAGGMIGVEAVAKAPPDGYMMVQLTVAQVCITPHLTRKLTFDPVKELAPITLTGDIFNVLVVHPQLPARSVKELIALARSRPGELNFGSSGVGVPDHLAGELFMNMTKTKLVHVPFKGGPLAMVDLMAGNVQMMFSTVASAIGAVRSGRMRALAITNGKRFSVLPDLPTVAEAGLPGFVVDNWTGVMAPAKTPTAIVSRLNATLVKAFAAQPTKNLLIESGIAVTTNTPDQFSAFIQSESAKWRKVVQDAKVVVD